jgi:hemolysin activation/secretion protein
LTLLLHHKTFDAFFDIHNRGSRYLGALQAQTALRLNNPLGFQEAVTFQMATAPDGFPHRELDFAAVQIEKPLGRHGTKIDMGASITSTDPGHTLQTFDIKGLAHAFHLGLSHAVLRSRAQNIFLALRFHYLDSERTDNLGLGKTEDRLRVLRLSADWDYADRFAGFTRANVTASKGIDVLNMKEKNTLNPTRARGEPEFFKVAFDLSRTQRLNRLFDLKVSLSGQKSAHKLLASEEFGIGGAAFGSAYDSSEITGEDGIAARLELQTAALETRAGMKPYLFYDIGKVWDADNTAANNRIRSIASAGIGTQFRIGSHLTGELEAAKPLTRRVETENDKGLRLFGRLSARF